MPAANQPAWRPHMVCTTMCAMRGSRCSCVKPTEVRATGAARSGSGAFSFHHRVPWSRTTLHPAAWTVEKPTQPSDQSGCARGVTLETIVYVPLQAISPSRLPLRRRNPCNEALSSAIPLCAIRDQLGPVGSCASGGCTAGCLSSAIVEAQPGQFLTRHQMFPAARACIQPAPTKK